MSEKPSAQFAVATPELNKLKKVQKNSQTIGAFLDWLISEKHCVIAQWRRENTVWEWLEISKEEFDKIKGQGKCVKCGKETMVPSDNLCFPHQRAYDRWEKISIETLQPIHFDSPDSPSLIEGLLADYYKIDLKKVEAEKQAIFEDLQKRNKQQKK